MRRRKKTTSSSKPSAVAFVERGALVFQVRFRPTALGSVVCEVRGNLGVA
jgi:hypothetical protein